MLMQNCSPSDVQRKLPLRHDWNKLAVQVAELQSQKTPARVKHAHPQASKGGHGQLQTAEDVMHEASSGSPFKSCKQTTANHKLSAGVILKDQESSMMSANIGLRAHALRPCGYWAGGGGGQSVKQKELSPTREPPLKSLLLKELAGLGPGFVAAAERHADRYLTGSFGAAQALSTTR